MSYSAYDLEDDRRNFELMLAHNAQYRPNGQAMLGAAVLRVRQNQRNDGGILSGGELVERLREPTAERARELYRQALNAYVLQHSKQKKG